MKESNSLAGNVAKNFLKRDKLLNIKGQHMKESKTLAGNVANNFLQRQVLPNTRECYIKTNRNLFNTIIVNKPGVSSVLFSLVEWVKIEGWVV